MSFIVKKSGDPASEIDSQEKIRALADNLVGYRETTT